jgi:hypothetical protein
MSYHGSNNLETSHIISPAAGDAMPFNDFLSGGITTKLETCSYFVTGMIVMFLDLQGQPGLDCLTQQ